MSKRTCRRGFALVATLLLLAIVSLLMAAITWQILAQRRQLDQRHQQLQALWLARSGLEVAVGRLLVNPTSVKEENLTLIPDSAVRLSIEPVKDAPDIFSITSEARYSLDAPNGGVVRSLTRRVRRSVAGEMVRIEVLTVEADER